MININQLTSCTISSHQCRCFDKLTAAEIKLIEDNSVKIKYKKGEVVCKQGSFASHIMYILRGLVKVYLDDGQNTLILKLIHEGNLLGLSSVSAEHSTFQYSAMVYVDSEIQLIEINVFKQLLSKNADFAKEVIEILSANSVQIYGRFFCLTHKQSYGRMADMLLCLSSKVFKNDEFELPLSRKDLADLSGMSSETVIRMLKKFKDEGLIVMEGKNIKVLDYNRLKHISEKG